MTSSSGPAGSRARAVRIRWSPRVQPDPIRGLYESDARGVPDLDLCDDVGIRLLLRCQSILYVLGGEVECPACGTVFRMTEVGDGERAACPGAGCSWGTTPAEYRQSWSKRRIFPGKAIPAFREFVERYPTARLYKDKIFLIDRLIHSFHWDLTVNLPNRSVANNLIEGNHDQVVAFLDALSGGEPETKRRWRETAEVMMKRRKGA